MRLFLLKLLRDNRGVTAVEYGLIVLLIVIALVGFVSTIGSATNKPFVTANNAINGTSP